MPYSSIADLPDQTKSLSETQKRRFKAAFNAAYEKYGEKRAFKIAWAAAKSDVDKREITVRAHTRSDGTAVSEHKRRIGTGAALVGAATMTFFARNPAHLRSFLGFVSRQPQPKQIGRTLELPQGRRNPFADAFAQMQKPSPSSRASANAYQVWHERLTKATEKLNAAYKRQDSSAINKGEKLVDALWESVPAPQQMPVPPVLRQEADRIFTLRHGGLRSQVDDVTMLPSMGAINVSGRVFKGNEHVGSFSRTFGSSREVHHDALQLIPSVQGTKFAQSFNRQAFEGYRRNGFDEVSLLANLDVGGYAWAAQGFQFRNAADAKFILTGKRIGTNVFDARRYGPEDMQQYRSLVDAQASGRTITPQQIADLGRSNTYKDADGFTRWLGKDLLLGSNWDGVLRLGAVVKNIAAWDIFWSWVQDANPPVNITDLPEDSDYPVHSEVVGASESDEMRLWDQIMNKSEVTKAYDDGKIGPWIESEIHRHFTNIADGLYGRGKITRKERIALSSAIGDALDRYVKSVESKAPAVYDLAKAREEIAKHLIGRHNQADHARSDHKTGSDRLYDVPFSSDTLKEDLNAESTDEIEAVKIGDKDVVVRNTRTGAVAHYVHRGAKDTPILQKRSMGRAVWSLAKLLGDELSVTSLMNWGQDITARSTKVVNKHLIGQHNQKDHDPTKGGHRRAQHSEMSRPLKEQAALSSLLGGLTAWQAAKPTFKGKGSGPVARTMYGLYALNFALSALSSADKARQIDEEFVEDQTGGQLATGPGPDATITKRDPEPGIVEHVLQELSEVSGARPDEILEALGGWMLRKKITHPTLKDLHKFMTSTYGG